MEKEESKTSSHKDAKNKTSSSKEKPKGYSNKASIAVSLRNTFFFMLYRYSTIVFITSLLVFFTSIGFFVFFSKQPVPPQYIPINEDGTYINLLPVSDCNSKSEAEVKKFVMSAINKMYKYDYINYSEQFQETASYFTTQGWSEYLEAFNQSGTLLAIKENMWVVSVEPKGLPEYTKEPVIEENACTWELKVPLIISYYGKNSDQSRGNLYLKVSRTSVLRNQDGLAIKRTIFKLV
jgi:intracellular multiplication protein IcmL